MKTMTLVVALFAVLGIVQQVSALGPPVEIEGTLDLMGPRQIIRPSALTDLC